MNNIQKAFSKNLKELRKARNLTQAQVAEGVGVETLTLQNYEYGRRFPKPEILQKIANFFDVNPEDIYKNDSSPKYSLSEKTPLAELLKLVNKKMSSIPDEVIEASLSFDKDDEVWQTVLGAFRSRLKTISKNNQKSKKA